MLKRTVSLTLAWMFTLSAWSGIMLYVAPPGRIAHWADWTLLGLDKTAWGHLHTVTTLLMLIAAGLHLYFNWKPFTSYMKDKVSRAFSATRELLVSLALTLVIALGTLYELPPFSLLIDTGDYVSESWEKSYGTPPYNHAELDTVARFCSRTGIDFDTAQSNLNSHGIRFDENALLLDIARDHDLSPQALYEKMGSKARKMTPAEGSGMGRKTLRQFCELQGLDPDMVVQMLARHGIKADPDMKFKEIAEAHGMNPIDLLEIIRSESKQP